MFPGVIAHPRVVPREGAVISGAFIPGGVRLLSFKPSFSLYFNHRWIRLVDVFLSLRSADGRWSEFHLCASITARL
jgi:hypothetical protein